MPAPGKYWGTNPRGIATKSSTGTPAIAITFHVEYNGTPYDRTVYLYLSDAAWEHSYKKLKRLGFNGDFDAPKFSVDGAELECKFEQYQGKDREKWELAGGDFEIAKADDGTIKAMARKWKLAEDGDTPF